MPPEKISDLLRSFRVQSWGEIARVGEPAAKPSHCPLCLKLLPLAEFKGVAPLRAGLVIITVFGPNYRAKHFRRSKLLSHIDVDSCYHIGVEYEYSQPIRSLHRLWRCFFFSVGASNFGLAAAAPAAPTPTALRYQFVGRAKINTIGLHAYYRKIDLCATGWLKGIAF